jgi:hypothetical protein
MITKYFTEHPASVGETYTGHMAMALSFSARLFMGAVACAIHAVLPFLFVKTGSATIDDLHSRMVVHRRVQPEHSLGVRAGRT